MRRKLLILGLLNLLVFEGIFAQTPFKSGNILVLRVGNGSIPMVTGAMPVFLDEYTTTGSLVQSIALPTTVIGSNKMFTLNGYSSDPGLESGLLNLSTNGQWLTLAGFDAAVGTSNSTLVNNSSINKTIALVDFNGVVNATTSLTDVDFGYPLGAVTSNGNDLWVSSEVKGINYVVKGSTTSTNLLSEPDGFLRNIAIFSNQLYACTVDRIILEVGSGLPTTGPQSSTNVPVIPGNDFEMSQFILFDLNPAIPGNDVMYVTDVVEGLRKFTFDGTNWIAQGTVGGDADDFFGITGVVNGGSVTLYCTRKLNINNSNGGGEIVTITDASGYAGSLSGTPVSVKLAASQTSIRGIAMVPQPASISLSTKAFLGGEYNSGLARHANVTAARVNALNANGLNQPFNVAPFNYAGTENVTPGFFTTDDGVTTDIVDWVLVELHDATTPSTIVAQKACFIREDGKIVDLDKTSNPTFTGVGANNYYVVIKNRNHLAIRSSSTVFVNGATPVLYDFTSGQAQAFQNSSITTNAAMRDIGGTFCMWSGNANMNNTVRFTGLNNDAATLLSGLGGNQAAVINPSYHPADINGDGILRFTGLNNDAAALLSALGGNQAAILQEHQ
jgi:hypothetical protein